MLLQWQALMENEKKQCSAMSEQDKFKYFLLMQFRSPYGWGKENPITADCSGSVCLALMMATGCRVRTTADGLLKQFFTVKNIEKNMIAAVFFIARNDRQHGTRVAKKGEAIHITGIVGNGVVFNSSYPRAELRTLESLKLEYGFKGCDAIVRGLNITALQQAHANGSDLFGLDDELKDYFGNEDAVNE